MRGVSNTRKVEIEMTKMTKHAYNGWSSRETWIVNLWLSNDEGTCNACRGCDAAQLEHYVNELVADRQIDGFLLDLLDSALASVNWQEIADSLKSD